jgi:hypothetical protein
VATKLKIIEDVADIVPAPSAAAGRSGESTRPALPQFEPAPTRKRIAGWNCRAQPVRGTGEHGNERQRGAGDGELQQGSAPRVYVASTLSTLLEFGSASNST